jgi:gluconolactonase
MDKRGRLYVAGGRNKPNKFETADEFPGGVYVLSPEGKKLDFIALADDEVTNCGFGGPDGKTLFITSGTGLWSVRIP